MYIAPATVSSPKIDAYLVKASELDSIFSASANQEMM